ncbi:hypothetical protein ACJMK2_027477 [Sinanodonta woodiana]|uniref:Ig-like domain-containing protein n=1 Tax=Sinanodonta woodiana TaxID=1069815 RepID=A0ABD3XMQ8_SINWO
MEIIKEAIITVLALFIYCYGETFGNTVVLSPANPVGDENGELELVCQLTPFPNATLRTVNWYLNRNLARMQRYTSDCTEYATGAGYDLNLYSFTCSGNTFKMMILGLLSSYNNNCWSCSVSFTNAAETDKATACITVRADFHV